MKRIAFCFSALAVLTFASLTQADTFGTGANQFTIDFVRISGNTNPTVAQTTADGLHGFGIVNYDYRMAVYEITNDQWNTFETALGVPVTGSPGAAYNMSAYYTDPEQPVNGISWYEAAQFVNWLNTSTGRQAAYNFVGTQGQSEYSFQTWDAADAAGGTNLYRHKDAFYFLPNEDEWVKAAYFNGDSIQSYATKDGAVPRHGKFSSEGWNFYKSGYVLSSRGPWAPGSGGEELNGTFDMMGNRWEWIESPYSDPNYGTDSLRGLRGGDSGSHYFVLEASYRYPGMLPEIEGSDLGIRVASIVPEPSSLILLTIGALGLLLHTRRRRW